MATRIESARDTLVTAADELDSEYEKFDSLDADEVVDVRSGRIEQLLNEADTELDSARGDATNEQLETIRTLSDHSGWLRALTSLAVAAGDVYDEWTIAMSYWDNDRFQDASDQMQVVRGHVEEAREELTIARERSEGVGGDVDDYDLEAMDPMDEWLVAMDITADGYSDMALGFQNLLPAAEAYDNERWDEAATGFADARDKFVRADGTFRDGEERVARWLQSDFIEYTCLAESFADAAEAYRESARAADRNDWNTANKKSDEAESAMNRCS